ncbi:YbaN family protein [Vibrio sonorensis]|uniref:YbaN family protein n=1 Tax=Vibrio sonorensis TaxID=1004316 RepID=UPI000A4C9BC9|nr:YbaN family protein [Vibrio sonorensis]
MTDYKKNKIPEHIRLKGYNCVGWTCVILGLIGVTVPLLPTVPFILLALYCFGCSSPEFQKWLLNHPKLGPLATRLKNKEGLTKKEKIQSLIVIWLSMGAVLFFVAYGTHWQWASSVYLPSKLGSFFALKHAQKSALRRFFFTSNN